MHDIMLEYTSRLCIDPSGCCNGKAIPPKPGRETLEIMLEIIYTLAGAELRRRQGALQRAANNALMWLVLFMAYPQMKTRSPCHCLNHSCAGPTEQTLGFD
jgi:hypothetical protein